MPFVGRSGPAARPHAGGHRPRPHERLHRQRHSLAPARQPHADAAGGGGVPALHRAPDRARRPRHPRLPRRPVGAGAARPEGRHHARRGAAGANTTPARARSAPSPTLHPAYLLRQPLQKRLAWRDFKAIRKALEESEPAGMQAWSFERQAIRCDPDRSPVAAPQRCQNSRPTDWRPPQPPIAGSTQASVWQRSVCEPRAWLRAATPMTPNANGRPRGGLRPSA